MMALQRLSTERGSCEPLFHRATPISVLLVLPLLVLSAVNPDHFPPWTSFHSEVSAFAASGILLASLGWSTRPTQIPKAVWLLLALISIAWIQHFTGLLQYAGDAWVVTAYLGAFGVSWLWAHHAASSGQRGLPLALVCWVLVLQGMLTTFQILAQWLAVGDQFAGWVFNGVGHRPGGNFGQPNVAATVLLMATASIALLNAQGRVAKWAAWLLAAVFATAIVVTQARAALLAAIVMSLLVVFMGRSNAALRGYRKDVICWCILLLGATWVFQTDPLGLWTANADASRFNHVGTRPIIWRQLIAAAAESPWLGYGWLQIAAAQQVGALQVAGIEQTNYAHNAILDLVLSIGLPGAAIVLAMSFTWFVRRWREINDSSRMAAAGLILLLPLVVHMQLELPHAYTYLLVPAGMLLGSFDAQTQSELDAPRRYRWACAAACLLFVPVLIGLGFEYAAAEDDYRVNRFENRRLGATPPAYSPPRLYMLTQLGEVLSAMRLRAERNMSQEDLDLLGRISRRYTWAPLHYRTALAFGLNGRSDEAGHQLLLIKSMFAAQIYEEGRQDWITLGETTYPELKAVRLPQ